MKRLSEKTKNQYLKGLKEYILNRGEEHLTHAYEMGRKAVQRGISELDLVSYHHDKLVELDGFEPDLNYEQKIQRASDYLKECLAPFEVKLGSYRKVIEELQGKNERLNEEIENRRQAEKELQRSRAHFQSLIENAQDIITIVDHNGIIRYESPSIERILGYNPKELNGRDAFQYIYPDEVDEVKKTFNEVISTEGKVASAEYRFRHKEGHWVYLESIAKDVPDSMDGPVVIVNSRDVTDRKIATRKLEEHKAQLAEAQRIAKVGSWEWTPGGEAGLDWSDEMCRIYGLDPEGFNRTYETFINFVHPEDRQRVKKIISNSLEDKESFSFEHRIIRHDKEERILQCRGQVVTDEKGEILKLIGTGQDITEQKEKEQRLREYSERLRNLSARLEQAREEERIRIAREVHDELGQMLTVLKMDISMFRGEMQQIASEKVMGFFKKEAQKILERINVIIKSVQRITTELRPEVLDDLGLKDAIDWQATEFGNRTGIDVNFETNVTHTDFLDDEQSTTLFRIFQETLTNIIRHSDATEVDVELNKDDHSMFLMVKDNGVGITQQQKEDSKSLGLIGIRERAQFLGGDVAIEGKKGEGTKVTLRIPFDQQ